MMFCTSHPGAWTPRRKAAPRETSKSIPVRTGSRNGKGSIPFSPLSAPMASNSMQEFHYLWFSPMINVWYRTYWQNCYQTAYYIIKWWVYTLKEKESNVVLKAICNLPITFIGIIFKGIRLQVLFFSSYTVLRKLLQSLQHKTNRISICSCWNLVPC